MQPDDVIWNIINHGHCSFKSKVAKERTFCTNTYNVTGLCLRSACPLANSKYATILEENGILYLNMKTAERAHKPKHLWEKIVLPANYTKALELVSEQLQYFPKYLVHRNKQRLTKIHQMIIRMRKLKLKSKPIIETLSTRVEQLEVKREAKALKAAKLSQSIESELLERLKQVSEGEIYNYPSTEYNKVLQNEKEKYQNSTSTNGKIGNEDEDEDEDLLDELEGISEFDVEYVEDDVVDDDDDEEEELGGSSNSSSNNKRSRDVTQTNNTNDDDDDDDEFDDNELIELYKKAKSKRDKMKKNDATTTTGSSSRSSRSKSKVTVEYEVEEEDEYQQERSMNEQKLMNQMQFNF